MKHILNIMATWRLMELLRDEDAPFDVLERFRMQVRYDSNHSQNKLVKSVSNEIQEILNCDWCLSIWCGLFVAICTKQNLVFALAYSAGALFMGAIRNERWENWFNNWGH